MEGRSEKDESFLMKPALFDTSVWIDFFNGKTNPHSNLLNSYIENDYSIFLCPIIIQEILQGISNDNEYRLARESLSGFDLLIYDPYEAAIGAADLYRSLRKRGITIRKSNDCLIAFFAIHFNLHLAHNDSDFERIASQSRLKILRA
jgi:predicted nucleic acid-binding protein